MQIRYFKDLCEPCFNVSEQVVQSGSVSTCGLHSLYFIIRMMDPLNKSSCVTNINVGEYVHIHYDMNEGNDLW